MVDERCVPFDHPDSNFGAAYRDLLSRVPARVHPPPAPACEASAYEAELARVFGADLPRFDLVLLGLGEDGHTASLFPDDPALRVTDRWVVTVARPDHPRLTLTLPVLSAARRALFLVRGASKAEALARLLDGDESIPAARVAAEAVLVVADLEAARATRTGAASVH